MANPVVTVLDDDQVGVDVVLPDGGIRVTEPVASGSDKGRTVATYTVGLSRVPNGTVTVHLSAPSQLLFRVLGSTQWVSSLDLTFTATSWSTPVTIEVTGRYDGKVEGQHAGRIDTTVTGGDAYDGQVTGGTGRDDEFVVAGTPFTPGTLRGYQVRIVGGTGAGQVRYVWSNTANVITVEEDWDVRPDSTSVYRITGYTTPAPLGQVGGTVVTVDPDRTTITLGSGVTLPTADGGLSGALIRIVGDGLTGSAYYRVIASNTAHSITVTDAWGSGVFGTGTSVVVLGVPGPVRRPDHRRDRRRGHPRRRHHAERRHHAAGRGCDERPGRALGQLHGAADPRPGQREDHHHARAARHPEPRRSERHAAPAASTPRTAPAATSSRCASSPVPASSCSATGRWC